MGAFLMMGSIILGVIALGVILGGDIDGNKNVARIGCCMLIIAIVMFCLEIYACEKCSDQPWKRENPYVTHTVMALSDGNEINGRFSRRRYCMSGYINEKYTYVYGYKTAGGGMKIQKAGEDTTVVYFRDDISPCAKWYEETKTFWWEKQTRYTCDIYVPTDSLQASITIDLQ